MTRAHRNAHRLVWWVLAPLLAFALAWAVIDRWSFPEADSIEELPR